MGNVGNRERLQEVEKVNYGDSGMIQDVLGIFGRDYHVVWVRIG